MSLRMRRWHRRLSWVAGMTLLLWAGSGLLHPLMSWTNPRPVASSPPALDAEPSIDQLQPLESVLRGLDVREIGYARLLWQDGAWLWQWADADRMEWQYADALTGQLRADADRRRAELLARHFSGAAESVVDAERLTRFSGEYPAVNRLLPVWRIRFDRSDRLSVYVHTGEDRLGALNDRRKNWLLRVFQAVHTLAWLDAVEWLRLPLIAAAVLSAVAMAMLGMAMLRTPAAKAGVPPPVRRLHRLLAWVIWAPALMLGCSGLFHLLTQSPLQAAVTAPGPAYAVDRLHTPVRLEPSVQSITLLPVSAVEALWRIEAAGSLRLLEAASGRERRGGEAELAAALVGLPATAMATPQSGFSDEYGFANKRLPVWRLRSGDRLLFVDGRAGVVAARVDPLDVVEQRSFSLLHKWQFLNPLGHAVRDLILSLAALLLIAAAVAGLMLRARRSAAPAQGADIHITERR